MKRSLIGLLVVVVSTAFASAAVPTEPEAQGKKLAVQIVKVESTKHYDIASPAYTDLLLNPEALLSDEENTLTQYPILYGEAGTSVTNDQTESISYVDGSSIVDGKVVPEEHIHKIGLLISVKISERDENKVKLDLNIQNEQFVGYDEYTTEEGQKVKLAYFNNQGYKKPITLSLGNWLVLGGILNSTTSSSETSYTSLYLVRVTDPSQK
jgi:hypothetical protein